MITSEMLQIHNKYDGYYDGYYMQNKNKSNIIDEDDWFLINNLVDDAMMIKKNLASKYFENKFFKQLKENIDNLDVMIYFMKIILTKNRNE